MIGIMAHALSHVEEEQGSTTDQSKLLLTLVVMSVSDLLLLKNHATLKNVQVMKNFIFTSAKFFVEFYLILNRILPCILYIVHYDFRYSQL